ncbi:MAG: MoaD/ThiS family protein [Tissierellia bacterium]|nr:MoaD/ThiS family protein [Tissierellia bacterium]
MEVKLKFLGRLGNEKPYSIELEEGTDLKGLLKIMEDKYSFGIMTTIRESVFLVNKSKIELNTVLKDGDEVMILSVLGGG